MLDGPGIIRYLAFTVAFLRRIFPAALFDVETLAESDAYSLVGLAVNLKVLSKGRLSQTDEFIDLLDNVIDTMRGKCWIFSLELDICHVPTSKVMESFIFELKDFVENNAGPRFMFKKLTDAMFVLENTLASKTSLPRSNSVLFRLRYSPHCPTSYQPEMFHDATHSPLPQMLVEPLHLNMSTIICKNKASSLMQHFESPQSAQISLVGGQRSSPIPGDPKLKKVTGRTPKRNNENRRKRKSQTSSSKELGSMESIEKDRGKKIRRPMTPPQTRPDPILDNIRDFLVTPLREALEPTQPLPGLECGPQQTKKPCECGNVAMEGAKCFICQRTMHRMCYAIPQRSNASRFRCVTCHSLEGRASDLVEMIRSRSLWYLIANSESFPLIADSFSHFGLDASTEHDIAIVAQLWSRLFTDKVIVTVPDSYLEQNPQSPASKMGLFKVSIDGIRTSPEMAKNSECTIRFAPVLNAVKVYDLWPYYLKYQIFTSRGGEIALLYLNKSRGKSASIKLLSPNSSQLSSVRSDTGISLALSQRTNLVDERRQALVTCSDPLSPLPPSLLVHTNLTEEKMVDDSSRPLIIGCQSSGIRMMTFEQSLDFMRQQSQYSSACESTVEAGSRDVCTPLFLRHC